MNYDQVIDHDQAIDALKSGKMVRRHDFEPHEYLVRMPERPLPPTPFTFDAFDVFVNEKTLRMCPWEWSEEAMSGMWEVVQ